MNAIDVSEHMARILDATVDLEKAESLSVIGSCAKHSVAEGDARNLFAVIDELVTRARQDITELAEKVRGVSR